MANGHAQVTPKSYPMIAGDDTRSYAQNSVYQKLVVDASKQMINEAITSYLEFNNKCLDTLNTIQIADLGCSVGPNTFFAIQNIVEAIEQKYQNECKTSPALDFQVFFNDHTDNDFNTLFKTLPPSRKYFPAGVPGSFLGRLFPKSSLHFAHTSTAIHWLSKVPQEIIDGKSPAWNKDSVYCSGSSKEVVGAYSAQFKNDFESFLSARSQELVSGGLMVILASSPPDSVLMSQTPYGFLFDTFGSSLNEMEKLGLISEEKVNSFNFPFYFAPRKELEESIDRNGCFTIKRIEILDNPMERISRSTQFIYPMFRAFTEAVVAEHFGHEIVDEIFDYFTQKLEQKIQNHHVYKGEIHKILNLFILLKRNAY